MALTDMLHELPSSACRHRLKRCVPSSIYSVDTEIAMNMYVRKWGNSAAVRIPAATLDAAGLKPDDPIEVREENGRIVIEKAKPQATTLEWLLEGITPENRHEEIDFGPAVGNEAW
ncbi:AbrB/MazE/SpoVT family DNA-binding domain-containing protein [Sphingosinicella sp. LHD-64]|uniref:AbrB/MazE/SpoVT family DNA-binding domain-containing protein n=1 Tax=Sphingosinicella sp. LHD-64 TaxID=3072139 RepID=UPI00280C64CB|nr:AbrB/MazE/SpoVT family DNA-binding domain-containing protein [Sphingosinicella sp. LHD-64]MDQ8758026.1 AbrB/MazE/SpoVT family DNA-binding domain-containing protein [Sphingosinicella sp. LHD-64]